MRALRLVAVAWLVGCAPTEIIVSGDTAPLDAAALDAPDAGPPVEPRPGGECDQQDDCETCRRCSTSPHLLCNDLALLCEESPSCFALATCLGSCAERGCARACADAHPEATALYLQLIRCTVCDACPADCRSATALWCEEPPF